MYTVPKTIHTLSVYVYLQYVEQMVQREYIIEESDLRM